LVSIAPVSAAPVTVSTPVRGQGVRVSGAVRLGTPEGFGTVFLAPRLGKLLDAHPDLNIELLTLPRFPSLASREADILVTLDPPQRGRYIASRLADFTYGLFASRDYVKRNGTIRDKAELQRHLVCGYIDELLPSPQLTYIDELLPDHHLRLATSGMLAQVSAVRAGLGVGVLAHYLTPGAGLVALLPKDAVRKRTFWLVTHADWYRLSRIRAVWDFVRQTCEAERAMFCPTTENLAFGVVTGTSVLQPAGKGAGRLRTVTRKAR
jgi:DNA-binding transcriptional LysR family regulator